MTLNPAANPRTAVRPPATLVVASLQLPLVSLHASVLGDVGDVGDAGDIGDVGDASSVSLDINWVQLVQISQAFHCATANFALP